jgi:WXG100 family type VII secretion target
MPNFVHTKVDPNHLSNAAGNIDNNLRSVEQAFRAIDESLRNTLHPSWSSPVSTNFFAQYSIDALGYASFLKAMQAFNEQLKQASGIYDGADSKARELVNNLRIG